MEDARLGRGRDVGLDGYTNQQMTTFSADEMRMARLEFDYRVCSFPCPTPDERKRRRDLVFLNTLVDEGRVASDHVPYALDELYDLSDRLRRMYEVPYQTSDHRKK